MAIGWLPLMLTRNRKRQSPAAPKSRRRFVPELQTLEERSAPAVQIFQTFDGLDRSQFSGTNPPDTIGVITPTHAVEMTNFGIGFYDRFDGSLDFGQHMNDFFQAVRFSDFLFDPICIYDDVAGRIILIAHDVDFGAERGFFTIAVSNTSNPFDGFTEMFSIETTEQNVNGTDTVWGDNAKVGQTADAIIISANSFGFNSGFSHTSILSIDKASIYDQDNGTLDFFDVNRTGFFSTIPANMFAAGAGDTSAWFVMNGAAANMRVTRMDNVLSAAPTFTDFTIIVPNHVAAPAFRQPGPNITSFDQRVLSVGWRNDHLVAAHQIGVAGAARARWYEFDTTNAAAPTLIQAGNVDPGTNTKDTYFPAIALAENMDIGIAYMQSGTTEFMSMYVTGRKANDPLGTTQNGVLAKAGVGTHNSGRAGDYSGIGVDPLNTNRFWGFSEYAKVNGGNWGTWISEFEIVPDVVAAPDFYSTNEDTPLGIGAPGLLGNDSSLSGPLSASLVTGAANGLAVVNADGSFTYTPNLNFFGVDAFTYRATAGASSDVATVTITVNPLNDLPSAADDPNYFVEGGTSLNIGAAAGVLANDVDPDGDPLSAFIVTGPTKGTFFLQLDGGFTYTPFVGQTGLDTFTYRAFDGVGFSNVATATILINNRPVAVADGFNTLWNRDLIVFSPGVLANDTDADGDPLTAELVTATANGSLNFVGTGGFTYTPNANFFGTDTFTYRVRDPFFVGNTVQVTINVEPTPVAGDDAFNAFAGIELVVGTPGVLFNDVNLLGGPLFAILVGGPQNGSLNFSADGSFRYLAVNNFVGVDTFTYKARTASGVESNIATVRITVSLPPNQPPIAQNDVYATFQGVPIQVNAPGVLTNDTDFEGNPLTAILASGTANGFLGLAADGSFAYTPNLGFVGVDSFTYRAHDGTNFSNLATVTIQVQAGTPPPTANADGYVAEKNTPLTVNAPGVLLNDTDPLGRPLGAMLASQANFGFVNLAGNGSFVYTPGLDFTGTDTFTYVAVAGGQFSVAATVTITVTNPVQPPTAANDSYSTVRNTPLHVDPFGVLNNDSDPQALPLTSILVAGPSHGILQLNADGSFDYSPVLNYLGPDSFTYQASNGLRLSNVATVSIIIVPGPGGPGQRVVVAADAGQEPRIKVFDGSSQTEIGSFLAYEVGFRGGVRVATADLTGDGVPDIIATPGAGRAPTLKVFDGVTFQPLAGKRGGFNAFGANFTGGVFVATGDVTGDGVHDLVASQDGGGSPSVRVFNGLTGNQLSSWMGNWVAYPTAFRGGVRVAVGDVNGDGKAEVITAPGAGTITGAQTGMVKTWDLTRKATGANTPFIIQQFKPYEPTFAGGIYVATDDLYGDGRPELITAPGAGRIGEVKIFSPNSTVADRTFTPLGAFTGGLRPATGDVDGDGRQDIILATGPGTAAKARFYDAITLGEMFPGGLEPFSPFVGGLFAAGVRRGR